MARSWAVPHTASLAQSTDSAEQNDSSLSVVVIVSVVMYVAGIDSNVVGAAAHADVFLESVD